MSGTEVYSAALTTLGRKSLLLCQGEAAMAQGFSWQRSKSKSTSTTLASTSFMWSLTAAGKTTHEPVGYVTLCSYHSQQVCMKCNLHSQVLATRRRAFWLGTNVPSWVCQQGPPATKVGMTERAVSQWIRSWTHTKGAVQVTF